MGTLYGLECPYPLSNDGSDRLNWRSRQAWDCLHILYEASGLVRRQGKQCPCTASIRFYFMHSTLESCTATFTSCTVNYTPCTQHLSYSTCLPLILYVTQLVSHSSYKSLNSWVTHSVSHSARESLIVYVTQLMSHSKCKSLILWVTHSVSHSTRESLIV